MIWNQLFGFEIQIYCLQNRTEKEVSNGTFLSEYIE